MTAPDTPSVLGPLRLPVFRMLWLAWLAANTTMWMNDVASAWLMTSLAPSPLWVALVQAASTLPVFLLGLPSGALADIVDRRRYFMTTQFWLAGTAAIMCAVVLLGWMTPGLLLVLTFANGVGLAMRWPVFAAIVPEVLPKPLLPQGLALNGLAMNGARIAGPLVAGAIIASTGSAWVFVLNAILSLGAAFTIMRWRRVHTESPLGRERLSSAMRVGVQYVRQSYRIRAILLRIALFFFHATALLALLPLVARALPGGDAGSFTVLLASMGSGAILAVLMMPRIRQWAPLPRLVLGGVGLYALGSAVAAFAPNLPLAVAGMFVAGGAWILVANLHTVSAQLALPDWVRARGMSIYQMAIMGASAVGAAVWGQLASATSIHHALGIAAVSCVLLMALAQRLMPEQAAPENLTPANRIEPREAAVQPGAGHVLTRVEYRIDPARAADFLAVMEDTRRSRLRQGALEWQLMHDLDDPARYVEQILDESWTQRLRRFDRITEDDAQLRDARLSLHLGPGEPVVTRYEVTRE